MLGQFTITGSVGALNIALPSIAADLHASDSQLQWVLVTYQLGFALFLIPGARLGDMFGVDRMLLTGLAGFVAASLVGASATDASVLIAARLAQGLCGALASPQVLTLVQRLAPVGARPRVLVWYGVAGGSGWMIGQLMTGVLLGIDPFGLGWRSAFLIYAPLGLVALAGLYQALPRSGRNHADRLDLVGLATATAGGVLFMYPLVQGRSAGWPPAYLAAIALAVPAFAAFVRRQRRLTSLRAAPLIDVRLFGIRSFRLGMALLVVNGMLVLPNFVFLTFTLQSGLGESALATSVITAPHTLAIMIVSFATSGFARRAGRAVYRYSAALLLAGYGLMVVTLLTAPDASPLWLVPSFLVQGAGVGLQTAPTITYALSGVPTHLAGVASGVMQTIQQLSGAIGIAVFGVVFFGVLSGAESAAAHSRALQVATLPVAILIAVTVAIHFALPAQMAAPDPIVRPKD